MRLFVYNSTRNYWILRSKQDQRNLFHSLLNTLCHLQSLHVVILEMERELGGLWKETVVACYKCLKHSCTSVYAAPPLSPNSLTFT
jgi:hypothetical protein